MVVAFRLRNQRDRSRIAELLGVSGMSVGLMYIGLLVLLAAGITAGFMGNHWGRGWIWASLGVLVTVVAAMYAIATPYYGRMRAAAGIPGSAEMATRSVRRRPPRTSTPSQAPCARWCWRSSAASAWSCSSG